MVNRTRKLEDLRDSGYFGRAVGIAGWFQHPAWVGGRREHEHSSVHNHPPRARSTRCINDVATP